MSRQASDSAPATAAVTGASGHPPAGAGMAAFGGLEVAERFAWIRTHYDGKVIASTSAGAQAAVMLHLLRKHAPGIPVVFIDTGYHFPETYQYLETLKESLGLEIEVFNPRMTAARQEALFGKLWEGGREELERYGRINKVEPMNRALQHFGASAWISGLRRSQSKDRGNLDFVTNQTRTTKLYPILDWSDEEIENYFYLYSLPRHPLLEKGYVSIGDWHSTRPLEEGETPEQTRFSGIKRECGLHEESNIADYQI